MHLWLDDIRSPESFGYAGFVWVKTYDEAIQLLRTGEVTFASLDHDILGDLPGLEVVRWMEANSVWPKHGTRIHSANETAAPLMEAIVEPHYPPHLLALFRYERSLNWYGIYQVSAD